MLNSFPRIKQSFLEFSPVLLKASLVAQTVNNLPAMQETRVRSLSEEDPSEEEIATHSSILGWRIPWTEEPGELQSVGLQSWTRLSDGHCRCHSSARGGTWEC